MKQLKDNPDSQAPLTAKPSTRVTLQGHYYYSLDVYNQEKDNIFYRSWQYIGHVSMLPKPSSYLVREIADQSVIVLRDSEGELRAFYNVCQHRAHRLLEGSGSLRRLITCPYHAWCYDQKGKLQLARGSEDMTDFDKTNIGMKSVRLENLGGFLFVNLDENAMSLAEQTPGLEAELREFSPDCEKLVEANRYSIPLKANWKNSIENFSECYHCPGQHKSLVQNALELDSYKIECYDNYHVHRSRGKGDDMGYSIDSEKVPHANEFRSFYIWPNTVFEVYPGGNLTVFHHIPVSPEETEQVIEWYFPTAEPSADDQAVIDFIHSVRMEDIPLCESVQQGLHSKGYDRGVFVVDSERTGLSEHAVYHFQQKVVESLNRGT